MKSFIEMVRSNIIVQAILSIALGAFLTLMPETTVLTIVYLLAAYLAVSGAASLISYFRGKNKSHHVPSVLITGVCFVVIALIVFAIPQVVAGFFSLILGLLLVVSGIVNAVRSLELRGYPGSIWIPTLIVSVAVSIGGIVIIVNPFATTVTFVLVLGILLIVKGIIDLVIEMSMTRAEKQPRKPATH